MFSWWDTKECAVGSDAAALLADTDYTKKNLSFGVYRIFSDETVLLEKRTLQYTQTTEKYISLSTREA